MKTLLKFTVVTVATLLLVVGCATSGRTGEKTGWTVLFDGKSTEALTDNYLKLRLACHHEPNRGLKARVERVADGALLATL